MIEIIFNEFKPDFGSPPFDSHLYLLVFDSEQVRDEAYDYFDPFASIEDDYDNDDEQGKYLLGIVIPASQFTNQVDNYLRIKKLKNITGKIKL